MKAYTLFKEGSYILRKLLESLLRELTEDKDCLSWFCFCRPISLTAYLQRSELFFHACCRVSSLWEIYDLVLYRKILAKPLPISIDSRLFLAQNNLYDNMAYLGFTYSDHIHSYFSFLRRVWVWGELLVRCPL